MSLYPECSTWHIFLHIADWAEFFVKYCKEKSLQYVYWLEAKLREKGGLGMFSFRDFILTSAMKFYILVLIIKMNEF